MRLVPNWKNIALKSWSMWAVYAGIFTLVVPEIMFILFRYDMNPYISAYLGLALLIGGALGRLVDQGIGDGK